MKGLSAAGESSQKDLEVWALKLPFPSLPRSREEQTGKEQGWDVDTEWGVEEKALDEVGLVSQGQQGLILGDGGGWSRLRWQQEGEPVQLSLRSGGGWRMDVLSSAGQRSILHLSGAVVTLPEEGQISSDPFCCHCGTCWEEMA